MKRGILSLTTLCFLLTTSLYADDDLEIGGYLNFDYRFLTKKDVPFYDIYSRAHLTLHKDISDNVAVELSGDFRLYGATGTTASADLASPAKQFQVDPFLWEAYVDVYDLGFDGVDLRVGKQLIAWGKADKLNPTANLNPDDFSDIFNFGEQIPSVAAKLEYEASDMFAFEIIWLPTMKPALMPRDNSIEMRGEMDQIMAPYQSMLGSLPSGMTLADPSVGITTPKYDLKHSMQAIKIKGTLLTIDYSISYLHGYDDVPVPHTISLAPDSTMTTINNDIDMDFFEYHVAGFDFAGEFFGIGFWVEGAVFFPANDATTVVTVPDFTTGQPVATTEELFDTTPYFKSTVGLDYTFSWSMYFNIQYAHGLPMERGNEKHINDYVFARLEQKFFHDKLKISVTGAVGITDIKDVKNNVGYLVNPEVKWLPYDSIEFVVGGYIIGGKGDGFLVALESHDMVYLQAKANF